MNAEPTLSRRKEPREFRLLEFTQKTKKPRNGRLEAGCGLTVRPNVIRHMPQLGRHPIEPVAPPDIPTVEAAFGRMGVA